MPRERRNPSISYAYKTAVFRIHNPSRHKRAMLDDALKRYHRAYTKTLAGLLPEFEYYAGADQPLGPELQNTNAWHDRLKSQPSAEA